MSELGGIYVIQAGPYFKIGMTTDVYSRTQEIMKRILKHQPKLPLLPVRLIANFDCWLLDMFAVEQALHKKFSEKRVAGEWFLLDLRTDLVWMFEQEEIPMWPMGLEGTVADILGIEDAWLQIPCPS